MRSSMALVCLLLTSACAGARAAAPALSERLPPLPSPDPPVVGEPVVVKPWPSSPPFLRRLEPAVDFDECRSPLAREDEEAVVVVVTFDAKGRARDVRVEPETLESEARACLRTAFSLLRLPAFAGREVTVRYGLRRWSY